MTTRDLIISAFLLTEIPSLRFTQLFVLVSFQKPRTRRTVRRVLDKLVAEGRVIEDKGPGLAAYSLAAPVAHPAVAERREP